MGPVVADPVRNDGDLDIGVLIDERLDDLFEKFDPFLEGVEPGRPEIEKRIRVDAEPGPRLECDEILPLCLQDVDRPGRISGRAPRTAPDTSVRKGR